MKVKTNTGKSTLHERNLHRSGYDFAALQIASPKLSEFVFVNDYGTMTIDFGNPAAVKALNAAILLHDYNVQGWDIPVENLCPPVPGRADYIHYVADLLATSNNNIIPEGSSINGLDIGTGANCIYPILGHSIYGWNFVATDIDANALVNCEKIISVNPSLAESISLQQQMNSRFIFRDIILPEDRFAFTVCNPPFHASIEEAAESNRRKSTNLHGSSQKPVLNFSGKQNELWYEGGEIAFITQMIYESIRYPMQCLWFTTLVSKKENLRTIYKLLDKVHAADIRTIDMAQGQKTSRIVAWTFQSEAQHRDWKF
jgi:23S rRNA (adenine1618-N6)-methyltransferase